VKEGSALTNRNGENEASLPELSTVEAYVCNWKTEEGARLLAWHALARRVAREFQTGGRSALLACQQATAHTLPTLRRWAFAGRRLSQREVAGLASWRDTSGRSLSVSHVIELARFATSRRKELLDAMQSALWPVSKLRVAARPRRSQASSDAVGERSEARGS
jgi:hypothetical protein